MRPSEAARRAVEDERVRLSSEIDRSVRRSLRAVRSLVASADEASDPRPGLVAIQAESRTAIAELRRQLGLIGSDGNARGEDLLTSGTTPTTSSPLHPLGRMDVATVLALWALIAAENALIAQRERPASWLMSAVLALTVLTRRLAPVLTALAGATMLMLGVVLDAPVADGFSFTLVVGLLLWSLLSRSPHRCLLPLPGCCSAAPWAAATRTTPPTDPSTSSY